MQEEKQELLIALCGYLPYGVKAQIKATNCIDGIHTLNLIDLNSFIENRPRDKDWYDIVTSIKPYLRPMSSMTEEESAELSNIISEWFDKELFYLTEEPFLEYALWKINYSINPQLFDWLNKKMFDFRGLIPKSLAIEVTEDNNPYKD